MTTSEVRAEVYNYIHKNILNKQVGAKEWNTCKKDLKKLMIMFRDTLSPEAPLPTKKEAPTKTQPQYDRERDLKNGVWRPDEFYK